MNQGDRIAMVMIPPLPDRRVLRALRSQVDSFRVGQHLLTEKLEYFRLAIAMDGFHGVVRWVRSRLGCDMFSTLQEIESMEQAFLRNDSVELIVQLCMILHFLEQEHIAPERRTSNVDEFSWVFESCRSLEEIAYLRSRLRSIRRGDGNQSSKAMYPSLLPVVNRCFLEPTDRPRWQGLLLLMKEAGSLHNYSLLDSLHEVLNEPYEVPAAAATLFLYYTADAIHFKTERDRAYRIGREEKIVLRLLELKASPMASRHNHPALFRRLENQLRTDRCPWWMELEDLKLQPYPTSLNMLLANEWGTESQEKFAKSTCCSLDAGPMFARNYKAKRVPKLSCLAARNLRETDLDELPSILRFLASKHLIIDLHWYDTWFSSP